MKRAFAVLAGTFAAFFVLFWLSFVAFADPPAPREMAFLQDQPAIAEGDFASQPAAAPRVLAAVPTSTSPAGGGTDWTFVADQLFNAIALALVGWIIRLIGPAALRVGDWIGQRAAAEDLLRDEKMTALSRLLAEQGLNFALGRLGYTRDDLKDVRIRNAAFDVAQRFVREQWPEIWKWIDQDKNGQIDWLESTVSGALPPVDHAKHAAPAAA